MQRSIADLLAHHDVFNSLPPDDLALIAGCGQNTAIAAGTYLFREGDPADTFFVLREGRVAMEVFVPDRGPLVVDTAEQGEIVGVSWLFPPYRWQFDGRVVEPVRAIRLDGACLRGKCEADPRLGFELMKRFAAIMQRRMRSARLRLVDLYGGAHAR